MASDLDNMNDDADPSRSIYDVDPTLDEDLWFLPAMPEDVAPTDLPWPVAARETSLDPVLWQAAEKEQYQALLAAVQAVTKFGERVRRLPEKVSGRFALGSVCAVLRSEGVWVSAEQIALYRAFRTASDDNAQNLGRASWAVRRLTQRTGGPQEGLRDFLGRSSVAAPQQVPGEERPLGEELTALSDQWARALGEMQMCHPLTVAAYGFASWRAEGITPYEDVLEPTIAALLIGAGDMAPFLVVAQGHRLDRHALQVGAAGAGERLAVFYRAIEAGALGAALELDRLLIWQDRAGAAISDLSGRTPPKMIEAFLCEPVISAEALAEQVGCTAVSARRNLNLFVDRGLLREVTGQDRYRFWTVAL